jgi:hypothetical protein
MSYERYISAAIDNEAAIVAQAQASTRNHTINRSAFKLGTLVGMPTDTAINALMLGAGANGYVKDHGEIATRKVIESGFKSGQRNTRTARSEVRPSIVTSARPRPEVAPPIQKPSLSSAFPTWTEPDEKGKPEFYTFGEEGPPVRPNEIRRHVYDLDRHTRRMKIKFKSASGQAKWCNAYRVVNRDGVVGWQYAKPTDYALTSYPPGINPFDPELAADDLYWPEGEKDTDSIVRLGLLAITFGGTGDGLPAGCETFFVGRNVVILADNDAGGREHAEKKAALVAQWRQAFA